MSSVPFVRPEADVTSRHQTGGMLKGIHRWIFDFQVQRGNSTLREQERISCMDNVNEVAYQPDDSCNISIILYSV
jgi:hypothetical protein